MLKYDNRSLVSRLLVLYPVDCDIFNISKSYHIAFTFLKFDVSIDILHPVFSFGKLYHGFMLHFSDLQKLNLFYAFLPPWNVKPVQFIVNDSELRWLSDHNNFDVISITFASSHVFYGRYYELGIYDNGGDNHG